MTDTVMIVLVEGNNYAVFPQRGASWPPLGCEGLPQVHLTIRLHVEAYLDLTLGKGVPGDAVKEGMMLVSAVGRWVVT